jgi:hypothetical protein
MIGGTSLTIGLLFLFLLSVDYPFRSRNGVSNEPLVEILAVFDKVDRAAKARGLNSRPVSQSPAPTG